MTMKTLLCFGSYTYNLTIQNQLFKFRMIFVICSNFTKTGEARSPLRRFQQIFRLQNLHQRRQRSVQPCRPKR